MFNDFVSKLNKGLNKSINNKINTNSIIYSSDTGPLGSQDTSKSYLGYTFNEFKNNLNTSLISTTSVKDNDAKNYLGDLDETLKLNMKMIETLLIKKSEIKEILENIRAKIEQKKFLKLKLYKKKADIFMLTQIKNETKSKIEESIDLYDSLYNELKSDSEKKDYIIKQMNDKINYIQIYINNLPINLNNDEIQIKKYKNWKIRDFMEINKNLIQRKKFFLKYKNDLNSKIINFKNEAEKKRTNKKKKDYKNPISLIINKTKDNIYVLSNRIKLLNNIMDDMNIKIISLKFYKDTNYIKILNNTDIIKEQKEGNNNVINEINVISNKKNERLNSDIFQSKEILSKKLEKSREEYLEKIGNLMNFREILNKKIDKKIVNKNNDNEKEQFFRKEFHGFYVINFIIIRKVTSLR